MATTIPVPFPLHLECHQGERFFSPPWAHILEENVLRCVWSRILDGSWVVGDVSTHHRCL